jgi:hypothetical protein
MKHCKKKRKAPTSNRVTRWNSFWFPFEMQIINRNKEVHDEEIQESPCNCRGLPINSLFEIIIASLSSVLVSFLDCNKRIICPRLSWE